MVERRFTYVGDPWQRQPDESPKAYQAFCWYRDTPPPRSVNEVYRRVLGRPHVKAASGTWHHWQQKFHWVERANLWDDEQDRVRREAILKHAADMGERHARAAALLQQRAMAKLTTMTDEEIKALKPRELVRMFEVGVTIERLARGEAAAKIEHEVTVGGEAPSGFLSSLSTDQLAQMLALLKGQAAPTLAEPPAIEATIRELADDEI